MTRMQKRFVMTVGVIIVVILAAIVYVLYTKSQVPVLEPVPEVTQESIARDLESFVPDPQTRRDPKEIEQELKSYVPPPEKRISDEEILKELNNPAIEPLPSVSR